MLSLAARGTAWPLVRSSCSLLPRGLLIIQGKAKPLGVGGSWPRGGGGEREGWFLGLGFKSKFNRSQKDPWFYSHFSVDVGFEGWSGERAGCSQLTLRSSGELDGPASHRDLGKWPDWTGASLRAAALLLSTCAVLLMIGSGNLHSGKADCFLVLGADPRMWRCLLQTLHLLLLLALAPYASLSWVWGEGS